MNKYEQYFEWTGVQLQHFYLYIIFAALIALFLTSRSKAKPKFELYFISFYLLTGNLNKLLTFKIPGLDLFEIQPIRFIFLLFLFYLTRKVILSRQKINFIFSKNLPWYQVMLFTYVIVLSISVLVNSSVIGVAETIEIIIDAIAFLIIIFSLGMMADKPSYDLIGRSIIVGAVISSLVSVIQLAIDPYFLRIGDARIAFAGVLRSNGIFDTEYFNSYYLIIAISWTLMTVKKNSLKLALVSLFTIGVLTSFQRMSWIILVLVLVTYLIYIKKVALEKLILTALIGIAAVLSLSIFYYQDIANSSLVKERLSDNINGRKGYYNLVLDNIGEKPLFGYGNLKNEVYYVNMLRITGNRSRATAEAGDLHSGYFSVLFLYGIPASICFVLFVVSSVFYYSRKYDNNAYFVIPFLVSILYMLGNLTNTFLFLKYIAVLYAIHMGIGIGLNQISKQSELVN